MTWREYTAQKLQGSLLFSCKRDWVIAGFALVFVRILGKGKLDEQSQCTLSKLWGELQYYVFHFHLSQKSGLCFSLCKFQNWLYDGLMIWQKWDRPGLSWRRTQELSRTEQKWWVLWTQWTLEKEEKEGRRSGDAGEQTTGGVFVENLSSFLNHSS